MTPRTLLPLMLLAGCASSAPAPKAGAPLEVVPPQVSLALTDMDAKPLDLEGALAQGETVALVFWQTWCASCASESGQVAAAAKEHRGAIRFVGVVPGKAERVDDAKVRATAKAWGYDFPQVRDTEMALSRGLKVKGTPTILILRGKEKRVVTFRGHHPPSDWGAYSAQRGAVECADGVCPMPAEKP